MPAAFSNQRVGSRSGKVEFGMNATPQNPRTASGVRMTPRMPMPRMPTPLLAPAIGVCTGVALSEALGAGVTWPGWAAAAVALAAALAALRRPEWWTSRALPMLLVLPLALSLGYWRHQASVTPSADSVALLVTDDGVLTRITGQLVSSPSVSPPPLRNVFLSYQPPRETRFVLAAESLVVDPKPSSLTGYVRVTVDADELGLHLGDRVRLTGRLYRSRGPSNPGETDWARQMRLQGIDAGMSVESSAHVVRVESGANWWRRGVDWLRGGARGLLFEPSATAPHDAAVRVLDSMVLGQRSAVGQQINEAFLRTGVIHFLSVSGTHVAALAGGAYWLLRRGLRVGAKPTAILTIVVLLLYLVLAEPNAPIFRATLMGVAVCVAVLLDRPMTPINWLCAAALLVLWRPLDLFQAGFQLSYVQVATILVVLPRIVRHGDVGESGESLPAEADTLARLAWQWSMGGLRAATLTCAVCWIAAAPLTIYHFGIFTPWAALHSLLLSPLIAAITLLSFAAMSIQLATYGVWIGPSMLVVWLTEWLLRLVDWLAAWPGTLIESAPPPAWLIVLTYALLTLAALRATARRARGSTWRARCRDVGTAVAALAAAWWVGFFGVTRHEPNVFICEALAVGSGSANLVIAPNGDAAMIDVGTMHNYDVGRVAVDAARDAGVRHLTFATVSHDNLDHYSGLPTLLKSMPTDRVISSAWFARWMNKPKSGEALARLLGEQRPRFEGVTSGDRLSLGPVAVEVLWPPPDPPDDWKENDRSLVLRFRYGRRSILVPGDIERVAIRRLLDLHNSGAIDLRSDVLIAPHHGSVVKGETSALLEAVLPDVIIISTSKERPEFAVAVGAALGRTARVLSTDDAGAVRITINAAGELRTETPLTRPSR